VHEANEPLRVGSSCWRIGAFGFRDVGLAGTRHGHAEAFAEHRLSIGGIGRHARIAHPRVLGNQRGFRRELEWLVRYGRRALAAFVVGATAKQQKNCKRTHDRAQDHRAETMTFR
jgi:hypothetical protein